MAVKWIKKKKKTKKPQKKFLKQYLAKEAGFGEESIFLKRKFGETF